MSVITTAKQKLLLGIGVIIITNVLVIGGVIYNRTGEPVSTVTLSERELPMPYSWHGASYASGENSALSLRIDFAQSADLTNMRVNKKQLKELGFTFIKSGDNFWTSSRTFYWALEYDGEHHAKDLQQLESKVTRAEQVLLAAQNGEDEQALTDAELVLNNAKLNYQRKAQKQTQLYLIDFDAELDNLVQKYSAQSNVIFMRGLIKPYRRYDVYPKRTSKEYIDADFNSEEDVPRFALGFEELLVSNIHIPLALTEPLHSLTRKEYDDFSAARYSIVVNIGQRLEPVVRSIERL